MNIEEALERAQDALALLRDIAYTQGMLDIATDPRLVDDGSGEKKFDWAAYAAGLEEGYQLCQVLEPTGMVDPKRIKPARRNRRPHPHLRLVASS